MAINLLSNSTSMQANNKLNASQRLLQSVQEKLASGKRINRAADDAATLAVSEALNAEVRSLQQASRNSGDGLAVANIADGAMGEIGNMVVRQRELAMQAASDGVNDEQRAAINGEFQELTAEIDRIAASTSFADNQLIDGTGTDMSFQVGTSPEASSQIDVEVSTLNTTSSALGVDSLAIDSKAGAQAALASLDSAQEAVSTNRATLGATSNRLESAQQNIEVQQQSTMEANSRMRDADIAAETANRASAEILSKMGVSVMAQANTSQGVALALLK